MIEFIILGDMGSGEPSQYSVAKQMKNNQSDQLRNDT